MHSAAQTIQPNRVPLLALFGANAISLTGSELTALAVPWFVLQTTGSPTLTGVTGFFSALPFVIGGLFGGAIADRVGYKRTSILADIASGVTIALIPLLHATNLLRFWLLLALVFLGTLLSMPGATARRALLPSLAQRADMRLEQVNATYSTMQNGAVLLGPALSGVLITVLGASNVLWLDAASFLISALLIGLGVPTTRAAPAASQHRYLADVREGLSFLVGNPLLRTIVLAAVIANFLLGPLFSVVLPVFVKNVYNDPTRLGILLATFGGGMVLGALGYGAVGYRLSRRILFIAGLCGMGAALLVTALLPPFGVMLLSMLVIGLMAAPANPLIQTLVQERTPADLLARVLGTLTALATAAIPLGVVLGGALVEAFGVRISLVVMAVGSLLVGISLLFSRALRGMERDA